MSETSDTASVACPACQKRYRVKAANFGKQATCKCGQTFIIAGPQGGAGASKDPRVGARDVVTSQRASCTNHPHQEAIAACARCKAFVCSTCDFPQNDGSHLCVDCAFKPATQPVAAASPTVNPYQSPSLPGSSAVNPFLSPSLPTVGSMGNCKWHPEVMALTRCRNCKTPVCNTCDFVFKGGVHICPACATDTTTRMSPSRKHLVGWSLAAAVWVTGLIGMLMVGALSEFLESDGGGLIVELAMQQPAIIGLGLAIGAIDRQAGNPPVVWVSVVWNGLTFAAYMLLLVIALMSMAA